MTHRFPFLETIHGMIGSDGSEAFVVVSDARWEEASRDGRLTTVGQLERGDRFVDALGNECTYVFADGAGLGATHHVTREDGSERLIAGWLKVLKL